MKYYESTGGMPNGFQNADPANPKFVEFRLDGSMITSDNQHRETVTYKILDENEMQVKYTYNSAPIQLKYFYVQSRDTLKLYPPCIEGCGYVYKAVE